MCILLFVSLLFVVLVAEVVLCEQVGVLGQRSSDLLLLLVAARVGDLDVASFGGRFIHYLLQSDVELAVHVFCRWVTALMLFVPGVASILRWDLVQNLGFRLFLA